MKIGVYVSVIAGQKGFEDNVSGHIQVPLRSIDELLKAGHDVHLITNAFGEDRSLPFCLPENIQIHFVTDSRERGGVMERTGRQKEGLNALQLLRQVSDIKAICKEQQFDVLHLFGYNRTAHLAGGLRLFGLKMPVVVTMFWANFPERLSFLTSRLWKRVDAIVTATAFVKDKMEKENLPTTQVRHGVIRDLSNEHDGSELQSPHRVLFWRDMTTQNGADVALAVYEQLAPKYPDIHFDFAVRPHWDPIQNADEIVSAHPNIHVFRFPYEDGISLPQLLLESLCVLMPIRHMSIDPQFVIVETLAAGIPIITTNQRSNPEFVIEGETGFLVPIGDVEATTKTLDTLLSDRQKTLEMGARAKKDIASRWNWNNYALEIESVYRKVIG